MKNEDCIILTIAPETTLKSFHVRKFIEKKLKENIKYLMKNNSIYVNKIQNIGARYSLETNNDKKAFDLLKKCFGIYSLSFSQKIKYGKIEEVFDFSSKFFIPKKGTFAVKGKSYSKCISSKKLEEECGSAIIKSKPNLKVNLSSPENVLHCIVDNKEAYFFREKVSGASGMPVGSQGTVGLICSGKKDEKLAWLLMKNGCCVRTINKQLNSLQEWNSGITLKEITIEESKKLYLDKKICAFFTTFNDIKKINNLSKKFGIKVFSPLIIDSYKTPFDKLARH